MPCLWLDTISLTSASRLGFGSDAVNFPAAGWVQGATAMARVLVDDAAVDPDDPSAGTKFDACEEVEFQGKRYRILQIDPISASFSLAYTYAVWLHGAVKQ
jgi:hypothetical protein